MRKYIVGLYASSPTLFNWDVHKEQLYFDAIKAERLQIRGLELPFWGNNLHPFDDEFLLANLQSEWEHVLTCIPGTMTSLGKNLHFGLSSNLESSRKRAIEMYERANQGVLKLNSSFARQNVLAVHISSAPRPRFGSIKQLIKSLNEISAWDWGGAKLVIEHCDSGLGAFKPIKGFFSIEDEIQAIQSAQHSKTELGLTVNWGRSVIEHRSPGGAIRHLEAARESGFLSGLIFSGTSEEKTEYGVWGDLHMPVAREQGISHYEAKSLLTLENMKASLLAADFSKLDYVGIKVLAMPIEAASLSRRVGVNRDSLVILDQAYKALELGTN